MSNVRTWLSIALEFLRLTKPPAPKPPPPPPVDAPTPLPDRSTLLPCPTCGVLSVPGGPHQVACRVRVVRCPGCGGLTRCGCRGGVK